MCALESLGGGQTEEGVCIGESRGGRTEEGVCIGESKGRAD